MEMKKIDLKLRAFSLLSGADSAAVLTNPSAGGGHLNLNLRRALNPPRTKPITKAEKKDKQIQKP